MTDANRPSVDLIIPAHNEAATLQHILESLFNDERLSRQVLNRVIVVNDYSTDDTAAIARRFSVDVIDTESFGFSSPGKGEALWSGFSSSTAEIVVACDGDLESFSADTVHTLLQPLFEFGDVMMTKAGYATAPGQESQRVTTLTAKPLLSILFPKLSHFASPLSGEIAMRREALKKLRLLRSYAVDIALLIDVAQLFGLEAIIEVDLGIKIHRHHSLATLGRQAEEVARAILLRSGGRDLLGPSGLHAQHHHMEDVLELDALMD